MQGSGLRNEVSFGEDSMCMAPGDVEVLQDDHDEAGWWDRGGRSTVEQGDIGKKRQSNPPPFFDPEMSLGDVSIIEGIEDDVVRAEEYLGERAAAATGIGSKPRAPVIEEDSDRHGRDLDDCEPISKSHSPRI